MKKPHVTRRAILRGLSTAAALPIIKPLLLGQKAMAAESKAEPTEEVRVGHGLDRAQQATNILVLDEAVERRVREIGQRVAKQAGRPDLTFTFRLMNDPQVNAYATSGGYIYINTGLLDFCDSEAELAAVIAHECTHITQRHLLNFIDEKRTAAIEAEAASIAVQILLSAAGSAAGNAAGVPNGGSQMNQLESEVGGLINQTVINPALEASVFGYRKDQEIEADRRGVKYMMDANYDPHAMIKLFDKMTLLRDRMIANHQPFTVGWINKQPGLVERKKLVVDLVTSLTQPATLSTEAPKS